MHQSEHKILAGAQEIRTEIFLSKPLLTLVQVTHYCGNVLSRALPVGCRSGSRSLASAHQMLVTYTATFGPTNKSPDIVKCLPGGKTIALWRPMTEAVQR